MASCPDPACVNISLRAFTKAHGLSWCLRLSVAEGGSSVWCLFHERWERKGQVLEAVLTCLSSRPRAHHTASVLSTLRCG